jgi:pimeloyl-ACP methyl ester carboxylesterase
MASNMKWRGIFLGAWMIGATTSAVTVAAADRSETFQDIRVTVRGEGKPVLMIPGLNSAGAVWDETCAALQPARIQCHIVQLPGFAGQAPVSSERFLESMRDRLLAYLAAKTKDPVVVLGHSLGGELALQMALKDPARIDKLVIVDSLPFFPAARDPKATSETTKPMAAGMRQGMMASPPDAYNTQLKAALRGMTRDAKRVERLEEWGLASDRATTSLAMYELFTIDLRADLVAIRKPTLVLGSWAAYAPFGATRESTRKIFEEQYRLLPGVRIELSEAGYHFLMWDDPEWLATQVKGFVAEGSKG